MVTAGDICVRDVVACDPGESVLDAARLMRDHHVGSVVLVDRRDGVERPVGILTDRDIVIGPVAGGARDLDALRAADVMARPAVIAHQDESLAHVLRTMRGFGLRRLPIVDADGGLCGVIAFDDLIEYMSEEMGEFAKLIERERERESTRAH